MRAPDRRRVDRLARLLCSPVLTSAHELSNRVASNRVWPCICSVGSLQTDATRFRDDEFVVSVSLVVVVVEYSSMMMMMMMMIAVVIVVVMIVVVAYTTMTNLLLLWYVEEEEEEDSDDSLCRHSRHRWETGWCCCSR